MNRYMFSAEQVEEIKRTTRKLRVSSNQLEQIVNENLKERIQNRDSICKVHEKLLAYYNAITSLLEIYSEATYVVMSNDLESL